MAACVATEATPLTGTARRASRVACGVSMRIRAVSSVISLADGFDIGVINGAVVLFREELQLTSWQVAWTLSIFPFAATLAAPAAGSVADAVGRKPALMLSVALLVVGGLLMATASGFWHMFLGRLTAGSGMGCGLTAVAVYMSEVAPVDQRGFYSSLEELFVNVGLVLSFAANVLLLGLPHDWRLMMGSGIIPAGVAFVALAVPQSLSGIPESPRYLQKTGRVEEARAALLELLGGDSKEVDKAFAAWKAEEVGGALPTWGEALSGFCGRHRRSALAGIGVGIIQIFTGIALIAVLTTSLLVDLGIGKSSAMRITLLLGIAKVVVLVTVSFCVLDSLGRRPMLLWSITVCTAAAILGAGSSHLGLGKEWQVAGLCIFAVGHSMGVGPVPYVYMPEVFDNRLRSKGCAVGFAGSRLCGALYLLLVPPAVPTVGLGGVFLLLVVVNAISFAYVAWLCPETKGRSLEEMHQVFEASHSSRAPGSCCAWRSKEGAKGRP